MIEWINITKRFHFLLISTAIDKGDIIKHINTDMERTNHICINKSIA